MTNRITVSLDDDARTALDGLVKRADKPQSELVRQALTFYAANYDAATADAEPNLEAYHQMLSSGEHVLLDVDFLHCFLDYVEDESGDPDPEFLELADKVSEYHAREYEHRFASLGELLDWLSFCGFLTVRATEGDTYHVVFPTESVKWFMMRFVELSAARLPFELEIEDGVSKVLITEVRRG
ncbi:ribbon-helix-helix protein, CopG family [Haladaptatus halobius]|jgi:Arc/MetJ-type ribon-helix-helix transcriptional regulator|uniref:ribbon-helix-helix protein, CopG family n=1 Tax=Haladaptatus halobius TaxID=2884875 RepID=UPI001D09B669|nr:ribbon-helix-helix protein, CopG family [Haladaptatus halobius]